MTTTTQKISSADTLLAALEPYRNQLPGTVFMKNRRMEALAEFKKQGLPIRKNEEYRYSHVAGLFSDELNSLPIGLSNTISKSKLDKWKITGLESYLITTVNGHFMEGLSDLVALEPSIKIRNATNLDTTPSALFDAHFGTYALNEADPFIALNTAFFSDVVIIEIPDNVVVEKPIVILNITDTQTASLVNTRNLIHVGKNSTVEVIELFVGENSDAHTLTNALGEIVVEEGAKALYYKIQDDCANLNIISTTQAAQHANSHFDTHTVTLGGKFVRNNLNIVLNGSGCETHLNGLFLLKENQHVDNHTLVDHAMPHCESNQTYKGILDDKSVGVFNGKIVVRPDAQKTNAYQSSKNMLLSDDASMYAKPQLEIYADDVKCSHGSSTGQIDEDALFYLRARGIGTENARSLLMVAFAQDVVHTIRIDALRAHINDRIEARLNTFN